MTYLMLFKYTQKGLENIRESPKRVDSTKQLVKAVGGEVRSFHLLMGEYDTAMLVDVPNDEAIAKVSLSVGSRGNVTCQTLPAFSESEFTKMISSLP